jgi:hypothetical protein
MSIQLILYPQSYNGLNPITGSPNQFLVDGIDFNTINTSSASVSLAQPTYQSAINLLNPTMVVNTWYRFSSDVALVTESAGTINITQYKGVIQKLSNLVVGATYDVTINTVTVIGNLYLKVYTGTTLQSSTPITILGTNNLQFTANSSTDTIVIYSDTINFVESISIQQAIQTPSGAIQNLGNGQVIVDLYEDEDIPLTLSIDEFKNVAEKIQSYSKAFNLPGTKRNNLIFDNIFEITRSDDGVVFNPYVKTQCEVKQDGFILFEGYLKLIDMQDKLGEISYNVNVYSEVIALIDVLKDKQLSDLSFAELQHLYNKTNIKDSWNTGVTYDNPSTSGFRNANTIKYPFVDWNHQYYLDANNFPVLPNLETAFRPFVNLKYIVQRIFDATPFSFTSEFFDNSDFLNLYMDFNWGSGNAPTQQVGTTFESYYFFNLGDGSAANYATTSYSVMNLCFNIPLLGGVTPPNYDDTTNIITSTVLNESYDINYNYGIENTDTVPRTVECHWLYNSQPLNYSGVITIQAGATFYYTGNLNQVMVNVGDTLQVQFKSDANSVVRQAQTTFPQYGAFAFFTTGISATTSNIFLQTLRGELGQWEFLKGIMTMFNLVSIPDKSNPNNILIEPYGDIFMSSNDVANPNFYDSNSKQLDWTNKIDISEIKLKPLTDLNKKTIFKFVEDDDDYAFNVFKNSLSGFLYGSKEYDASGYTILEGEKEIIAEPFAATVPKQLMSQFDDFITPAIYSYDSSDGTSEGFDNSPRIMFNNGIKNLNSCTYFIPTQNGVSSENATAYLQFSHLSNVPTLPSSRDFHFGECQYMPGLGSTSNNNLFNLYWLPYFNELYNPNTRTMTLKVDLNSGDINNFNFYDTVFIKNREFRVNKIDYKPNDLATVEFILIT